MSLPTHREMSHTIAAESFAELGNEIRLAVFRYLVKAGPEGAPVGEIQKALNIPASTLSHHLSRMINVNLISQERASRSMICRANLDLLHQLIEYLKEECCVGHSDLDVDNDNKTNNSQKDSNKDCPL